MFKAIEKFNESIALRITLVVSTMWCFYAFFILSILPMLLPKLQDKILYVSNCFQLVLLPLIMVGQSLIGRAAEKRAMEDHETIMAEFTELKHLHEHIHALIEEVDDVLEEVDQDNDKPHPSHE